MPKSRSLDRQASNSNNEEPRQNAERRRRADNEEPITEESNQRNKVNKAPKSEIGIAYKRERTPPPSARTFIDLIRRNVRAAARA